MPMAQPTSSPPPTPANDTDALVAGLVECAALTAYVPTLLQIARGIEQCGYHADLRFKRDADGNIADGIEITVERDPHPKTVSWLGWLAITASLVCKYCDHDVSVDVLIRNGTANAGTYVDHPSRPEWRAAHEASCRHCLAVYPIEVLDQLTELDDAVRELNGEANEVPA